MPMQGGGGRRRDGIGSVVRAQGLGKRFGRGARAVQALTELTFDLEPGTCLALLGANGSGKSTTLHLVVGLLRPTQGALSVLGGAAGRREARAETGYVPEEARRFDALTGRETVTLFARLQGLGPARVRRQRVEESLRAVGLEPRSWSQPLASYSRGMARRLALATAWVHRPAFLVLDEPTSGLDPLGVDDVLSVLEEHRRAGGTTLVSTHDREALERAADFALVLDHGEVRLQGTPQALLGGDTTPSLRGLIEAARHG